MRVLARLMHANLKKLVCARTVARNFGVRSWASEHTQHTKDARHERLLHYTCGVATGTVAEGNETQLFCSWSASLYVVIGIAWKS